MKGKMYISDRSHSRRMQNWRLSWDILQVCYTTRRQLTIGCLLSLPLTCWCYITFCIEQDSPMATCHKYNFFWLQPKTWRGFFSLSWKDAPKIGIFQRFITELETASGRTLQCLPVMATHGMMHLLWHQRPRWRPHLQEHAHLTQRPVGCFSHHFL